MVVFSYIPLPNNLKYRDHRWDLPAFWKKDFIGHILVSLTSIYESSASDFFRTTTGIQSGPDIFDNELVTNVKLCLNQ